MELVGLGVAEPTSDVWKLRQDAVECGHGGLFGALRARLPYEKEGFRLQRKG